MEKYILASGSPRRKEILTQVGISFEVIKSNCEEIITDDTPDKVVMELARIKCMDVAEKITVIDNETIYVIGADTMVYFGNEPMGKPKSYEDAYEMINKLQGNIHQVYTGVCIIKLESNKRLEESFAEVTDVSVVNMNHDEICNYLSCDEYIDKAGAYGIQGMFSKYISKINGDYYNVVGFPICKFCEILKLLKTS